jgi:predicted transposase/invertase (TIGR01784 family)
MPVRFLRYITELYESFRGIPKDGKFPAVFPVLLYSGDTKWTAQFEISNVIEKSIPDKYIPAFSYYPILENEIPKKSLEKIKNAVSAIFYIENSSPQELKDEIDRLIEIIQGEDIEIYREFARWFNNYLSGIEGIEEKDNISKRIENVMEVKAMFATRMKEHDEKLLEQGIKQGIEKGIQDTIIRLQQKGFSSTEISELMDIPVKEIEQKE